MNIKLFVLLLIFVSASFAQTELINQNISLQNGSSFSLSIPQGFEVVPAAEGLKRVRFFAKAPDGRIFVTDMFNLTDNKKGTIYILDDLNEETGKFGKVIKYLTGLHNPNSVQFYTDDAGQDWIYIAETERLTRRKFDRGEVKPSDLRPETIMTFPDYGLSYKYGGWHLTRTIAFGTNKKLYVSIGSSCNSCIEKEKVRAAVYEMDPDGAKKRRFAYGLRNAVGLRWFDNKLFASNQGSDHLGNGRPDETMYDVREGRDYGWPYCHSSRGKIFADPKLKRRSGCRRTPVPFAYFPARSSALGFEFFNETDSAFNGSFLVSLHGSTNKSTARGYKIVKFKKGEKPTDLITGFLQKGKVFGRPCDIFKLNANTFLFSDDHSGTVFLVRASKT